MPPRFSIIVVHYQGSNPPDVYLRGINSLFAQTFRDFEILCYHDGPLLDPGAPSPVPIRCTERRHNDFGHSLRDRGIREATGEYIVHFNADNVLYPDALAEIDAALRREPVLRTASGKAMDTDDIVIFPIVLWDFQYFNGLVRGPKGTGIGLTLSGIPPVHGLIDCMQLVMKRSLWLAEGGWTDRRPEGDGRMYEKFAAKYGHRCVPKVLGEHH